MPIITVETNLKYEDIPEDFGQSLSKFTSETLDKPEEVNTCLPYFRFKYVLLRMFSC